MFAQLVKGFLRTVNHSRLALEMSLFPPHQSFKNLGRSSVLCGLSLTVSAKDKLCCNGLKVCMGCYLIDGPEVPQILVWFRLKQLTACPDTATAFSIVSLVERGRDFTKSIWPTDPMFHFKYDLCGANLIISPLYVICWNVQLNNFNLYVTMISTSQLTSLLRHG